MVLCATACVLSAADAADIEEQMRRFTEVYSVIEEACADLINPNVAFYAGEIPGMLRRLDPHSVFFDPLQFRQLQELQTSAHKGFGTILSVTPGRLIVLQTLAGTPSARSGLEPGDEILAIDGIAIDQRLVDRIGTQPARGDDAPVLAGQQITGCEGDDDIGRRDLALVDQFKIQFKTSIRGDRLRPGSVAGHHDHGPEEPRLRRGGCCGGRCGRQVRRGWGGGQIGGGGSGRDLGRGGRLGGRWGLGLEGRPRSECHSWDGGTCQ